MFYPDDFINELICGNSLKILPIMPDESVDLIFTDPPYSLGYGRYDNSENFYNAEEELYRVLKNDKFLIFYWATKKLPEPFWRLKKFKYVWQIIGYFPTTYSKSRLGDRKYIPLLVFEKGNAKLAYKQSDMAYAYELPFVVEKIKNTLFKPTATNAQIIQMFSNPGEIILDPFCGFGSIPFVCKFFDRNFIGIDIDQKCVEIAQKFIKNDKITYIGKE